MKTIGKINILGAHFMVKKGYENSISDLYGQIKYTDKVILLNDHSCVSREQTEDTLLHEVIHGIDERLKLGLKEEMVHRLATGLYASGVRVKLERVRR